MAFCPGSGWWWGVRVESWGGGGGGGGLWAGLEVGVGLKREGKETVL